MFLVALICLFVRNITPQVMNKLQWNLMAGGNENKWLNLGGKQGHDLVLMEMCALQVIHLAFNSIPFFYKKVLSHADCAKLADGQRFE